MARHLVEAGHTVVGHDIDQAAMDRAAATGVTPADDPAAVATAADAVVLSLPGPAAVTAVVDEAIAGFDGGETVIDCTTSRPDTTSAVAEHLAGHDVALLGAPVSGGQSGAEAGTLSAIVGGSPAALEATRGVLEAFTDDVFHVSDRPEHGHACKLLNNYLSFTALVATSEAVALGADLGLDVDTMVSVFSASTGRNSATEDKFPNQIVTGAYDAGFAMGLMDKDIKLFAEFAEEREMRLMLGTVLRNLVGYARSDRGPEADMTEIYPFLRELSASPD